MSNEKLVKILHSLPFLQHLNSLEIEFISKNFKILQFEKGEILQYENEIKPFFYYLLNGEVKLYKIDRLDNEIFLYNLLEHSIITNFNHKNLNFEDPCYANIEFIKKSEILCVDSKYIASLVRDDEKMAFELLKSDYTKMRLLENTITQNMVYDATARVAYMIVNNLEKINNLKKYEIAYELHIQPETLSRILAKMSRNGLINIDKNSIKIKNELGLKEIYEQENIC